MPLISSRYTAPFFYRNQHLHTIASSKIRPFQHIPTKKEILVTSDNDVLHIHRSTKRRDKLVLILHGLGGHHASPYQLGMANAFIDIGYQAALVNLRGAGLEPNRTKYSYHAGRSEDLTDMVNFYAETYSEIVLVGFSLGASIILKYLGEDPENVSPKITHAIAVSAPCNLNDAAQNLGKPKNKIYARYFIKKLKKTILPKFEKYPELELDVEQFKSIKTIQEIDDLYTAPVHGFGYSENFYQKSSAHQFLDYINRPTFILTAQDDPFLTWSCYPFEQAKSNDNLYFEAPTEGGHVAFATDYLFRKPTYAERRAIEFVQHGLN